jgi:hypothetical protein
MISLLNVNDAQSYGSYASPHKDENFQLSRFKFSQPEARNRYGLRCD